MFKDIIQQYLNFFKCLFPQPQPVQVPILPPGRVVRR